MAGNYTYSFLDVNCAISGPGAAFNLGAGAANAEEGISVTANEEIDGMMIGADGNGMHSLHANKSGKVTIRLLKNSPTNALLSAALAFQRASGATFGQNTITVVQKASGDSITCQQVAFAKVPDINYAKEGGLIEWDFNAITIDISLGAGVQA